MTPISSMNRIKFNFHFHFTFMLAHCKDNNLAIRRAHKNCFKVKMFILREFVNLMDFYMVGMVVPIKVEGLSCLLVRKLYSHL